MWLKYVHSSRMSSRINQIRKGQRPQEATEEQEETHLNSIRRKEKGKETVTTDEKSSAIVYGMEYRHVIDLEAGPNAPIYV